MRATSKTFKAKCIPLAELASCNRIRIMQQSGYMTVRYGNFLVKRRQTCISTAIDEETDNIAFLEGSLLDKLVCHKCGHRWVRGSSIRTMR